MQFNCFNHSSVRYAPHYSPVDKCLLARLRPNTLCWRADNHIVLRRPPIQANAQQQETAAVYKPPDLNTASLLLLFFESYKRANGRPLVEGVKELVKIPEHLWGLKCCIFIAMHQAPAIAHGFATSSRSRTGVSTTARSSHHDDHADTEPGPVIVYANAAAQGALKPQLLAGGPAGNSAADSHSHTTTHLTQGDMKLEGQPAAAVIPNIDKVINQAPASLPLGALPQARVVRDMLMLTACGTSLRADCVMVDVASPTGAVLGQAVLFERWSVGEEHVGRPLLAPVHRALVPGAAELAAAQEGVRRLADAVRALKARSTTQSSDLEVTAAVAELTAGKAALAVTEEWVLRPPPQLLHALMDGKEQC